MSFEIFFSAKTSTALFISFENCTGNIAKEAIKACIIDVDHVDIQLLVSNYKKVKLDTNFNWTRK